MRQPPSRRVRFLRKWRGVPFVQRAPTRSGRDVPIHVTKMESEHVFWWHSHVQPIIDADPTRADNDWNWLLNASVAAVAGRVLAREPVGYAVGLSDPDTDAFVPCALVQLLGRFPALDDHKRDGVFVWFLSTAPDEALTTIEEHPIPEDQNPPAARQHCARRSGHAFAQQAAARANGALCGRARW